MSRKVVLCGAGFVGSHIARALAASSSLPRSGRFQVQISSRRPERLHSFLENTIAEGCLLPPVPLDVTIPSTLDPAFKDADVVVSLVGVLHGSSKKFEDVQFRGAENVARAARDTGAKLIHISAIGADAQNSIPYWKTKGLAEKSILNIIPDATIIRPSLIFGPGDDFFSRFSRMSKFLPFLPVFDGGKTRFQPVYVGDVAKIVEILSRNDPGVDKMVAGNFLEAGGPDILTYRQLMELVLKYSNRRRPIISVPYEVGMIQGWIMERLPHNMFTVTCAQIEQLKQDNIVDPSPSQDVVSFTDILKQYSAGSRASVHDILPTYLSGET